MLHCDKILRTTEITREIGHFQKYHNTLFFLSKILHKHCFHFLLGLNIVLVPRENKSNTYAKKFLEGQTKSIMVFLKVAYAAT